MPRLRQALLFTVVAVIVLLGAALLVLHQWVGTPGFKRWVEAEASSALGLPVNVGRIEVDVWPLPAVAVNDVVVQTRPALTVGRIEARPDWAGVLAGRLALSKVIVHRASLSQQSIDTVIKSLQKKKLSTQVAPDPLVKSSNKFAVSVTQVILDDISWVGLKGDQATIDAIAHLNADGWPDTLKTTLVKSQFKGLGDLQGTQIELKRQGQRWAVAVLVAGGGAGGFAGSGTMAGAGKGAIKGHVDIEMPTASNGDIKAQGQLTTTGLDLALIGHKPPPGHAPMSGRLEAQTTLSTRAASAGALMDVLQTQSTFTVRDAVVQGIDLAKAVTTVGLSRGGETRLDVLAGQVQTRGKTIQLSNLVASSGVLSASGNVSISAASALSGRINVELGAAVLPTAAKGIVGVPLVVGGTLEAPEVNLTRAALVGAAIGTAVLPGVGTGAGASLGDKVGEKLKGLFGR